MINILSRLIVVLTIISEAFKTTSLPLNQTACQVLVALIFAGFQRDTVLKLLYQDTARVLPTNPTMLVQAPPVLKQTLRCTQCMARCSRLARLSQKPQDDCGLTNNSRLHSPSNLYRGRLASQEHTHSEKLPPSKYPGEAKQHSS